MEIEEVTKFLFADLELKPSTLIHAGASFCQERDLYAATKFDQVYWIEAIPDVVIKSKNLIANHPNQEILEAVLWESPGERKKFHIYSNQGESSSLLNPSKHRLVHPTIYKSKTIKVRTTTLDLLFGSHIKNNNFYVSLLVIDLQGADLSALKGGRTILSKTLAVFTEVSLVDFYRDQPLFNDVHNFLTQQGFVLVRHDLGNQVLMGDALYLSQKIAAQYSIPTLEAVSGKFKIKTDIRRRIRYALIRMGVPAKMLIKNRFVQRN